jgi:hypothetical protein
MAYIGRQNLGGAYRQLDDISSGFDGSDTTHTMQVNSQNVTVGDVNQIILSLGGVIQKPGTDFTVSGSVLTFTTAPAANTSFFAMLLGSDNGGTVTPTDGSVTGDKIASDLSIATNVSITTADNTDTLSLISTDADANAGPILRLFRNSASPADDDVAGSIVFSGEDDNGNETDYASIKVITEDVTNGTEDGRLSFNIIDGGSAKEVMSIFDDFVGIGTTAPEQLLHIHAADSGSTYTADSADRLIIEHNDSLRIDMRTGTTNTVGIMFSDTTRNRASISYSHSTDHMTLTHEGDESIVMGGGRLQTGGETAGDVDAGGLTLNQGANDNKIFSLKSSDVDHGMTSIAQTDTYAYMAKGSGTAGGLQLDSLAEGEDGFTMHSYVTTSATSKSTSANAAIMFKGRKKSSTSAGSLSDANANIMAIADHNTRRFLFDIEGDFHADSGSTTFDAYEDAHLVRAYDLSHGKGVIDSKFDKFVSYNHEKLADLQLVGREKDGTPNHFINVTGMQRLHNGAIWQQYEKHQRLAEAVYEMAKEALGEDKADAILEKHDIKLLN